MVEIQIELLVVGIIVIVFLVWAIWYRWSLKRALKKYNPNEDKSKGGEDKRRAIVVSGELGTETATGRSEKIDSAATRLSEPSERELLPPTSVSSDGILEPDNSRDEQIVGKTSSRFGKLLKRIRRK